jgi:hypothetical protein
METAQPHNTVHCRPAATKLEFQTSLRRQSGFIVVAEGKRKEGMIYVLGQ